VTKKRKRRGRVLRTLTALRLKLDMSQEELAREMGLWQPDISMFESGALPLSSERANQILSVFVAHPSSNVLPDGLTARDLPLPWDDVLLRLAGVHRASSEG